MCMCCILSFFFFFFFFKKRATPEDILNFTLEADLKKRQEFDPDISLLDRVKEIKPGLEYDCR